MKRERETERQRERKREREKVLIWRVLPDEYAHMITIRHKQRTELTN